MVEPMSHFFEIKHLMYGRTSAKKLLRVEVYHIGNETAVFVN
jgi:hypothetical protein